MPGINNISGVVLQGLMQPTVPDVAGSFNAGRAGHLQNEQRLQTIAASQGNQARAASQEQRQQTTFDQGQDTKIQMDAAYGVLAAFKLGDGAGRKRILNNILKKVPEGGPIYESVSQLANMPEGEDKENTFIAAIDQFSRVGLLPPKEKATKSAEILQQEADAKTKQANAAEIKAGKMDEGLTKDQVKTELGVKVQNAATDAKNAITRSTELTTKESLANLLIKYDSLPEDHPHKEIYKKAIDKKVHSPGKEERPHLAELSKLGYMPGTRVTGPLLDYLESGAAAAAATGNPWSVEFIRQMEFEAVKNRKTGSSAGARLVLARKHNIESATGLLNDMKATSEKLDFPKLRLAGEVVKAWKGQSNNPLLNEYMAQRADALMVLTAALKQNGVTDKAIEIEEDAAPKTMDPKAFNAWYNTQIRALNRAAGEMNKTYGFSIRLNPSFSAGQGGAATPEQPTPEMPATETTKRIKFDAQGNML